jgi:acetylornithine deacetylase/succinyl-diaminopimelate desuccinylase-like protein
VGDEERPDGAREGAGGRGGRRGGRAGARALTGAPSAATPVVELLRELIRADTVNPPGNETRAAELLRDFLQDAGVEVELLAKVPGRANLVARLRGRGTGPSLCLLSHTDTVLADPAEWQRDPWSGDRVGDEVWGRGALDMKGQVAASAVALASLAREGFRPNGDLVLVAAADEEVGDGYGLQWLVREHPDAVRTDYAINEGGGDRVVLGDRIVYLCATAEKMSAPFRLRVHGRSGHASQPGIADNALVKAARIVERLAAYRPRREHLPETEALLRVVLGEVPSAEEAAERAGAVHPLARTLLEPLLSLTFVPTMIEASRKRNVIPALCELVVDSRLQPGRTPEDAREELRAAIGDGGYEYELIEAAGGTRSPLETPLWDAVSAFVRREEPEALVAPYGCAGFTDSHWLREAFGTVAYGFFPMRAMDPETAALLVHSADERAHVDDLELGVRWLRFAAERIGSLSA